MRKANVGRKLTTSKILLSLDLSTTCTGWSVFNIETQELITYGTVKGKTFKDTSTQRATLKKLEHMAESLLNIIENYKPHYIVIEEIAGSKNRIGQKTLDMAHGILWKCIEKYLDLVYYYDVTGKNGWRFDLELKLSEEDKANNKEAKKMNPGLSKASQLPVYNAKDLAARYANAQYNLSLDPQENQYDNDIADSISMGCAFLKFRCPKV